MTTTVFEKKPILSDLFDIYDLAEAGVGLLSKFRLVLPLGFNTSKTRSKSIDTWPPTFKFDRLSKKQQNYLKKRGIRLNTTRIDYYRIPFIQYNKMKGKSITIDSTRFEILKDYFVFEKIRIMDQLSKLSENTTLKIAILARNSLPKSMIPNTTANRTEINALRHRGDVLWNFRYGDRKAKIPAFLGPTVFYTLNLLKGHPISFIETRNKNNQLIKPRNVIKAQSKSKFNLLSEKSFQNLIRLIVNSDLFQIAKEIHQKYEKEKSKPKWKIDICNSI